jgi:hypothetical protein
MYENLQAFCSPNVYVSQKDESTGRFVATLDKEGITFPGKYMTFVFEQLPSNFNSARYMLGKVWVPSQHRYWGTASLLEYRHLYSVLKFQFRKMMNFNFTARDLDDPETFYKYKIEPPE